MALQNRILVPALSIFIGFMVLYHSVGRASRSVMARLPDGETPVAFHPHLIDRMPGAYQCSVADMNGDGKPDIIALSPGQVAWYENPTWKKHPITTTTKSNIDIAAFDFDGDGKLEIAIASDFDLGNTRQGGQIEWYKPGPDVTALWIGHEIAKLPTAHRLRWADWDGNGKKELVAVPILGPGATAPAYASPISIVSYAFQKGQFVAHTVDTSLTVAHGMRILDWEGTGHDDLLVASYEGVTLFRPKGKGDSRSWQKMPLATGEQAQARRGASEVDRGWLLGANGEKGKAGHRPFLATIEPWHGNEMVVYLPPSNGKGLWQRHVIDTSMEDGHALVCADLDGDGQSEILAGYRGGAHNLYCYRCTDGQGLKWERSVIDMGDMAGAGIVAADINGDGGIDLVCTGSATANVKWYENVK